MRYVNVLWPEEMEKEYLRLFGECTDMTPEQDMEDEARFALIVNRYISEHASEKLKNWLKELEETENQPA
ncbi:MAG: hypothetical protein II875_04340 [Clostridia bacterium]|nr:hypothetical protein [Clostridia bacterium]